MRIGLDIMLALMLSTLLSPVTLSVSDNSSAAFIVTLDVCGASGAMPASAADLLYLPSATPITLEAAGPVFGWPAPDLIYSPAFSRLVIPPLEA